MSWSDDKELSSQANIIYRLKFSIKIKNKKNKKIKNTFLFCIFPISKNSPFRDFFLTVSINNNH